MTAVALVGQGVVAQVAGQVQDLLDDLARVEVAGQPAPGGGAEAARHGAAHLRGDAESGVRLHGYHDALDPVAIAQGEQMLARAVPGDLALDGA